jgi:hypothetical protein
MVLAVTEFADVASFALKVEGGCVEEDDIESGEEILVTMKQLLFDDVLGAARQEGAVFLVFTVAMTCWTDFLFSLRFSTIWRY